MSSESKPVYTIGPKSPEQWGDLFLDTAIRILASQSAGPDDLAIEYAMTRAALFVERAVAMQGRDACV